MNRAHCNWQALAALQLFCLLIGVPGLVQAATTHLCGGAGSPCTVPAVSFVSGTGPSSATLSGNPDTDTIVVDSGQTAFHPNQTYYNFGILQNEGELNLGDGVDYPWLRIMGPGSQLDNRAVTNNLTTVYVQDNNILGTNAPSGSGSIYNRSSATFNNGSSMTYSDGSYFYGEIDAFDAALIQNDGAFNNYSYFYMEGPSSLVNNGVLTNYSTASPPFGSEFLVEGTVTNTGTIHNVVDAAMSISGTFDVTSTGSFMNEGLFEALAYSAGVGNLNNAGQVEITATATGPAPGFYSPGRFLQTAGALTVNGAFVQSKFDIQAGNVTGGGLLDTTKSNVPGSGATVVIGPSAMLHPGNGSDNSLEIVGDVSLAGALVVEIGGGGTAGAGQGTLYDFLHAGGDTFASSSSGHLQLGGQLTVQLINSFQPQVGDWFDIIAADGGLSGDFLSPSIFTADGTTFERSQVGDTVRLTVVGAIPEPSTFLLVVGLLLVATPGTGRKG